MHIECQGTRLTVAGQPDQGNDAPPQTRLDIEKDGQRRPYLCRIHQFTVRVHR